MAISERSRSILYQRLTEVVHDEEAVGEMLAHFPAHDGDRPASREFVSASLADLRIDLQADITSLRVEVGDLRRDVDGLLGLRTEFADLRTEFADLRTEFADLRAEVRGDITDLRAEVHTDGAEREQRLMTFIHQEVRASTRWTVGFLVSSQAVLVAALRMAA